MAYTLAQLVKLETDPLKKYVMENLLRKIKVMEVLPFENVDSLRLSAIRWRHLPGVAFRGINGTYTEDTTGDVEEVWESLYVLGGLINFDRVFRKVKNTLVDPEKLQLDMKLTSLAHYFNYYFIHGDTATDPLGFEGLEKRVAGSPARQLTIPTAAGATSLDVTASVANANRFWTTIERSHKFCNDGNVSAMFCNEDVLLGLGRSLRFINASAGNFLDVTQDSFDRQVLAYKGAPIYDVGLRADQTTEILTDTETAADAGSDGCSIYFCSFNMEQGIMGAQLGPIEVVADAQKDVATVNKTLIEWVLGLAGFGSYGIVRMWNILAPDTWTA